MADVTSPFGFPYPEDTDLVRDGAQDIENLATGVNDYLNGGYLYVGTRYYTANGTFLKADPLGTGDIGLRAVRVRLVAGGGGGGGGAITAAGQTSVASGGGGGGYAEAFLLAASFDSSVTVTVGSGGAGGTGALGSGGGASSFGTGLCSADGGAGGQIRAANAALEIPGNSGVGVGVDGDLLISGSRPERGFASGSGFFSVTGGFGGSSALGSGGGGGRRGTGSAGVQGGGGGGISNDAGQATAGVGGAGGAGLVIVEVYA
jgi:hypothetical protein